MQNRKTCYQHTRAQLLTDGKVNEGMQLQEYADEVGYC